jgi:DHA1 family tetracycline resistance protein-like MFS transporter
MSQVDKSQSDPQSPPSSKGRLKLILLILLVDLLGFTLVVPLLPRYADLAGFSPTRIGMLMSAYPFCQLFAGPILGRLSDRYGRKPVLVASQMGTTISFLILAFTKQFEFMLLARMLDGASGGNILVAQSYVADVTPPKDRAKSFGMIGMVFGMGFILGPTLGGFLSGIDLGPNSLRLPFLVAAMFSMIAWIIVAIKLPESRPAGSNQGTESRVIGREGVRTVMRDYRLQLLVLSSALLIMGWSSLEGTFSLFLKRRMGYTPSQASWAFAFLGFVGAFGQGFLIRRLVVRFGEKKLVVAGMCTLIVGFLMLSQVSMTLLLLPTLVVVGLGQGMANPSMTSLVSRSSGPAVQGAVFGAMTSAQTFARMLNYSFANQLLGRFGESAPFYTGAMALLLGLIVVRMAIRRLNEDPVDIHSHGS